MRLYPPNPLLSSTLVILLTCYCVLLSKPFAGVMMLYDRLRWIPYPLMHCNINDFTKISIIIIILSHFKSVDSRGWQVCLSNAQYLCLNLE